MNPEITPFKAAAWAPSSSALAESSSELEALVSVIDETFWMALPTSPADSDCSWVACAILAMLAAVSSTPWTIVLSDWPAACESWAPSATRWVDSLISAVISLAAARERSASLRTSSATTAKPRPC